MSIAGLGEGQSKTAAAVGGIYRFEFEHWRVAHALDSEHLG